MSSKSKTTSEGRMDWRVRLRLKPGTKQRIIDEAKEDGRHYNFVLSKILEERYGNKAD